MQVYVMLRIDHIKDDCYCATVALPLDFLRYYNGNRTFVVEDSFICSDWGSRLENSTYRYRELELHSRQAAEERIIEWTDAILYAAKCFDIKVRIRVDRGKPGWRLKIIHILEGIVRWWRSKLWKHRS